MINQICQEHMNVIKPEEFLASDFCHSLLGEIVILSFFGSSIKGANINGVELQKEVGEIFSEISTISFQIFFVLKQQLFGQKVWKIFSSKREKALYQRVTNLIDYIDQIITKKMNSQSEGTFIDAYFEYTRSNKQIPRDEMVQQFITMFNAGIDTTSYLITTALYFLGEDQQTQKEIYDEVLHAWPVEYEKLNNLPILSAFINECLRLYSPFQTLFPRRALKDMVINDIKIKKGWFINMNIQGTGSNNAFYENALQINYKRWFKQQNKDPFTFIPFSAGGRNCIGQHLAQIETKIILASLIKNFIFKTDPNISSQWVFKTTYRNEPQTKIKCERRKENE